MTDIESLHVLAEPDLDQVLERAMNVYSQVITDYYEQLQTLCGPST